MSKLKECYCPRLRLVGRTVFVSAFFKLVIFQGVVFDKYLVCFRGLAAVYCSLHSFLAFCLFWLFDLTSASCGLRSCASLKLGVHDAF